MTQEREVTLYGKLADPLGALVRVCGGRAQRRCERSATAWRRSNRVSASYLRTPGSGHALTERSPLTERSFNRAVRSNSFQ